MSADLAGRTAIVTGGATGIGKATALLLAEHGANVAILGRGAESGQLVADEVERFGVRAQNVVVDLADADAIGPSVQAVIDHFGAVDILVNNAAARNLDRSLGRTGLFETTVASWDYVQAVNARAPMLLIQIVGRHMIDRGEGGRIVNVTSSSAFQATHNSPQYAASKAALTALTRTAAGELGPHGINVNAVAPSLTRTEYRQRMGGDEFFQRAAREGPTANLLQRVTEPEDVAAAIVFLCLPDSRQITGQTIHTSAGQLV
jgi:NAD(P)-dependent dehydrogenase (short-subunit alcohol dehydrogenase family)